MNIKDLSKLDINDLKNLDFAKIQEGILAKPDLAVNVALVLLSLFAMFQIFNSRQGEIRNMKGQLEELEKKSAIVDTYHSTQKQLTDLIGSLPKGIQEDKVIDQLTDMAANRNVQILSFSPAQRESKRYYDKIVVNLNIVSNSYKNICLFVNDIEQSPYAMRLEKWSGSMEDISSLSQTTEISSTQANINAQITAVSINFKNEQQ